MTDDPHVVPPDDETDDGPNVPTVVVVGLGLAVIGAFAAVALIWPDFLGRLADNIADAAVTWILTLVAAAASTVGLARWRKQAPSAKDPVVPPAREPAPSWRERLRHEVPTNLDPVEDFRGRDLDLRALVGTPDGGDHRESLVGRNRVVVVRGPRGIGTSWCIWGAGRRLVDKRRRFRDGVFRVDVAAELTRHRGLLNSVAVEAGLGAVDVADDLDGAAQLSGLLSRRQMLFLVDNVEAREQIAPLLAANLHLLVAARPGFDLGRHAGEVHHLGPLEAGTAVELFVDAHPHGTDETAAQCRAQAGDITRILGRRPGLIHAVACSPANRTAAHLAFDLRAAEAVAPFGEFAAGNQSVVEEVCAADQSYQDLTRKGRRAVRLLSITSQYLPPDAAAALLGRLRPQWDELAAHRFVQSRHGHRGEGDDRRLRPDVRPLARLHLLREEPQPARRRAYVRLVRHLAPLAATAMADLGPTADSTATAWFARHEGPLRELVVVPAPPRRARRPWFRLAEALCAWYEHDGQAGSATTVCEAVAASARAAGLVDVEGWAHGELGKLALGRGDQQGARHQLEIALRQRGRTGQAQIKTNIAAALLSLDTTEPLSLDDLEAVIARLDEAKEHLGSSDTLGLGAVERLLGAALLRRAERRAEQAAHDPQTPLLRREDLERAEGHLVAAANHLDRRDASGFAEALNMLVLVYGAQEHDGIRRPHQHPRPAREATRVGRAALHEYEQLGDLEGQARCRLNVASVLLSRPAPQTDEARALLEDSLAQLATLGPSRLLARTWLSYGDALDLDVGDPRTAWHKARSTAAAADDSATAQAAAERLGAGHGEDALGVGGVEGEFEP